MNYRLLIFMIRKLLLKWKPEKSLEDSIKSGYLWENIRFKYIILLSKDIN